MREYIKIEGVRDAYCAEDCVSNTHTAADMIAVLNGFDPDTPIIISFDNGYTYGYIDGWRIEVDEMETDDDYDDDEDEDEDEE